MDFIDGTLNKGIFNANGMQNTQEKNQHHLAMEHGIKANSF